MPRTEKQPAEEVRLKSDSSHLPFSPGSRFAHSFHRNAIVHTLTLGRALMPAGLSVEGRIMRHACDPRRAWLKHHKSLLLSWSGSMEDGGVQLARMMTLKNHRQPNVYHIQRRRPQQQSSRCRRTWQHVYVCPSGLGAHAIALTFVMLDCFQHALDNGNLALLARELEQLEASPFRNLIQRRSRKKLPLVSPSRIHTTSSLSTACHPKVTCDPPGSRAKYAHFRSLPAISLHLASCCFRAACSCRTQVEIKAR